MGKVGRIMANLAAHDAKMRRVALSRPECAGCGGIPKEGPVRLVNNKSHKAAWMHLCGPCQDWLVDRRHQDRLPDYLLHMQHWI